MKLRALWIAAQALTAFAMVAAAGCGSDHHVSPWPESVRIDQLAAPTNLDAQLSRVASEMTREKLTRTV